MKSLNIYESKTGFTRGNIIRLIESKLYDDYSQSINYVRNKNSTFIPILLRSGDSLKSILTGSRKFDRVALPTEEKIINGKKT